MSSVAVTSGTRAVAEPPDLRDSDAYARLEQVFSLLDSPQPQPQPDWQQLADSAADLLAQAMDLRVAGWQTFALIRLRQPEQATRTLKQIGNAVSCAWDSSLPARERARLAALQWLQAALSREANTLPFTEQALADLQGVLRLIGSALEAHSAPHSKEWQRLADSLAPTADACTGMVTPEPASSVSSQEPLPARDSIGSERAAQQQLRRLQDAATPLLEWWLTQPDQRDSALQLARSLTWGGIGQLPQHDEDGHTSLRPPPAERVKQYDTLWQQAEYARLLLHLENSLRKAPFWLDGHYLAARCCHALNDANAASIIQAQTRSLVQRLPGLECLRFDDGSAFASPTTQSWLQQPSTDQGRGQPDNTPDPVATAAQHSAATTQPPVADTYPAPGPVDERQRALARLQGARLALAESRHEQARDLLEPQLAQLQQSMPLALWDRQLLSDTLELLLQSLAVRRDNTSQQRSHALQQQLRWLHFQSPLEQANRPERHGEAQ